MSGFEHIGRCFSLDDEDVRKAVATRAETKSLLDHLVAIAKPNEGAPKILLVLARMATSACDWLDGELRVEIVGGGDVCVIEVMTELGDGLRERALPSLSLGVSLAEFVRAVERVPRMIEPLLVKAKTERRLVLVSKAERAGRSLPPAAVAIAEMHLIELPRAAPPGVAQPPPPKVPRPGPPKVPRPGPRK